MTKLKVSLLGLSLLIFGSSVGVADSFDKIKADLANSDCTRFEFISILESSIFDVVDSTEGQAYIASDGRYNIIVTGDQYLFDGVNLYSYSAENNQVVIETLDSGYVKSDEISYITRLDDYYQTMVVTPDRQYRLLRRPGVLGDIPDSMTVWVNSTRMVLELITYLDVNEELNRIVIKNQTVDSKCLENSFEPTFPDSVERIKL
jgi:outer membrane lipoprotein-sorting protein